MMDFLIKHNLINPSQHGSLRARSCLTNVLCFFEETTKWVDEGSPVDVEFLVLFGIYNTMIIEQAKYNTHGQYNLFGFQKAFDKVPHQRLILNLKPYGMGNCSFRNTVAGCRS